MTDTTDRPEDTTPGKVAIRGIPDNPLLYVGLDVGIRHDTAALVATYLDTRDNVYCLFDHRIWIPTKTQEVVVPQITEAFLRLVRTCNVAGLWYDNYQYVSEAQRLVEAGYGHLLHEVNQSNENVLFSNNMKDILTSGRYVFYPDPVCRQHVRDASIKVSDRGWYIKKSIQAKPIDFLVALAMSLYGAVQAGSQVTQHAYSPARHRKSLLSAA